MRSRGPRISSDPWLTWGAILAVQSRMTHSTRNTGMSRLPTDPCVTSLPKGATLPPVAFVSLGARLPSQSRRSGRTLGPWFSLVSCSIEAVLPFVSRVALKPNFSFPPV